MRLFVFAFTFFFSFAMYGQRVLGPAPQKSIPQSVKTAEEKAPPKTPQAKAKASTEQLTEYLKLNATQEEQVRKVNLDFELAMDKVVKNKTLSKKENYAQRRELHRNRTAALKKIFTPDQYRRYSLGFGS